VTPNTALSLYRSANRTGYTLHPVVEQLRASNNSCVGEDFLYVFKGARGAPGYVWPMILLDARDLADCPPAGARRYRPAETGNRGAHGAGCLP
jgi:hypothetical protein